MNHTTYLNEAHDLVSEFTGAELALMYGIELSVRCESRTGTWQDCSFSETATAGLRHYSRRRKAKTAPASSPQGVDDA